MQDCGGEVQVPVDEVDGKIELPMHNGGREVQVPVMLITWYTGHASSNNMHVYHPCMYIHGSEEATKQRCNNYLM